MATRTNKVNTESVKAKAAATSAAAEPVKKSPAGIAKVSKEIDKKVATANAVSQATKDKKEAKSKTQYHAKIKAKNSEAAPIVKPEQKADQQEQKETRGGKRENAGRKKGEKQTGTLAFRVDLELKEKAQAQHGKDLLPLFNKWLISITKKK